MLGAAPLLLSFYCSEQRRTAYAIMKSGAVAIKTVHTSKLHVTMFLKRSYKWETVLYFQYCICLKPMPGWKLELVEFQHYSFVPLA